MKNILLASGLLVAGCATAPGLTPQQAAVADYVQTNLPDSTDSYQPVRWGKMTVFRTSDVAALDLPDANNLYAATTAKLRKDSAGYVLVASTAREFHTADDDVAAVREAYQLSLANRDSARARLRRVVATAADTTRVGYQLAHTFRAKNLEGQLIADSAGFLVNLHGVVIANVAPKHFTFSGSPSNRARFLGITPPPPITQTIPLDARMVEQLNAQLPDTVPR